MAWFLSYISKSTMMEKRFTLVVLAIFIFILPGLSRGELNFYSGAFFQTPEEEKLSLYPNPAKDHLKIDFQSDNDVVPEIQIIDLTGKVVKRFNRQMNLEQDIFKTELDISFLQPGVYFVKVIQGKELFSKKLMVK